MKAVEDGLAMSKQTGNNYCDAELWPLEGELVKVQNKTAEAEDGRSLIHAVSAKGGISNRAVGVFGRLRGHVLTYPAWGCSSDG